MLNKIKSAKDKNDLSVKQASKNNNLKNNEIVEMTDEELNLCLMRMEYLEIITGRF